MKFIAEVVSGECFRLWSLQLLVASVDSSVAGLPQCYSLLHNINGIGLVAGWCNVRNG